ncbi:hypothetical protein [Flavobacterium sp. LC2016-13]|uniref:hypothetical protein n=2 Tax=unclassified Flavobacterium TaxID=196869 RepID=UPI0012B9636A|nr:hypothetical protein [Flavobacterium sp. LC2016-13]MTD69282.1 hypothetical protein [Flavobacterium sp. LC2016-13]
MKRILSIAILALLFTNCNGNSKSENRRSSKDNLNAELQKDSTNKVAEENKENQNDCLSNTKITNLPITNSIIDGNNVWNELDCNIANLDTKDYLRLPDINGIKVFIIGNFNFDDFTYTLVTLKNNKVITKKDIGFAKEGDEPNTVSEFTQFEINKDYVFGLNTKTKNGEDFKTLKTEKFKIDDNGLIVVVK